jgi:hypothetical protein
MPLNIAAFAKPHSQDLQRQPQQQRNGKGLFCVGWMSLQRVLQVQAAAVTGRLPYVLSHDSS